MVRVSSSEFIKGYGTLSDKALVEPVTITRNGRDRLVVVSAEMFEEMHRASVRSRSIEQLDADEIAAIAASRVPAEYAHLDEKARA
jgi:PHD/YefM family antitoxin component YafN of YafNO toxin-antitoxin module